MVHIFVSPGVETPDRDVWMLYAGLREHEGVVMVPHGYREAAGWR